MDLNLQLEPKVATRSLNTDFVSNFLSFLLQFLKKQFLSLFAIFWMEYHNFFLIIEFLEDDIVF